MIIEFVGEDKSVYQELAEKDHYLLLAAEAGKVLLEKNQELSEQYSKLQGDYMHKIEVRIKFKIIIKKKNVQKLIV